MKSQEVSNQCMHAFRSYPAQIFNEFDGFIPATAIPTFTQQMWSISCLSAEDPVDWETFLL